jgi:hypothetical protein
MSGRRRVNLFRYCDDDPVDRSDPTGLFDMWGNLHSLFVGNPSMASAKRSKPHIEATTSYTGTAKPSSS